MSDVIEANIGPYLDEFIQTMQCIQARAAVTSTPATLSDAGVTHFATSCSNLASATLDNGRNISEISLRTLLNQCQHLLSIHSARDRPSTPTSIPTAILAPPPTQERPTPTPIPCPNSVIPTIEPIPSVMHFNPRYPTAPSPSYSTSNSYTGNSSTSMSKTPDEDDSPDCSSIFEPVREEELSNGEDTDSVLAERRTQRWMKRQQKKKKNLEDTVRFPRYRSVVPNVQMRPGQRMGEPVEERDDDLEDVGRGTVETPIYLDESDVDSDVDSDSDSEMEDVMDEDEVEVPRHRGTSVSLESVLKHFETKLRWEMEVGIWQKS
ncbi:hypothetical protein DL98DRAFT_651397 [Cadophora sp. DSE1049]|nr:hypothetical protein DL98DRAFT_651397 [Cadophora sp. DSE1049]